MKRITLEPQELKDLSDENLFVLLEDLQIATRNLMMEGWRRGIVKELAEKAMEVKENGIFQ